MPTGRRACRSLHFGLLLWGVGASASAAPWRGISYGVSPDEGVLLNDDMFNDDARPQWGCPGRGDLRLIAQMGANVVRLYGNDPRFSHRAFLDEAVSLGLGVIPGVSDWPYIQSEDYCSIHNDSAYVWSNGSKALAGGQLFDCHNSIMSSYAGNLRNGFTVNLASSPGTASVAYHPAMRAMVAFNEPELKLGKKPRHWAKAVISAIDGMLSAEDKAGLKSPKLPITVCVSFAICRQCEEFSDRPALGQMWTLRDAMRHPLKYRFRPRHNLSEFYDTRFFNTLNTFNRAYEIQGLFLNEYSNSPKGFAGTPVFIAEYHSPLEPVSRELSAILSIASNSKELLGISFFEWINRHDEEGHTTWGMFNLSRPVITRMINSGTWYRVRSLVPRRDRYGANIPLSLAKAYGGNYSQELMCQPPAVQDEVLLP